MYMLISDVWVCVIPCSKTDLWWIVYWMPWWDTGLIQVGSNWRPQECQEMLLWGEITPEMWGEMQSPSLLEYVMSAKDAHGWAGAAGQFPWRSHFLTQWQVPCFSIEPCGQPMHLVWLWDPNRELSPYQLLEGFGGRNPMERHLLHSQSF